MYGDENVLYYSFTLRKSILGPYPVGDLGDTYFKRVIFGLYIVMIF